MIQKKIKPASIHEYIEAAPIEVQEKLIQMHNSICKAAPEADESIKWGMPAYSYQKILVTFAVFRHHIGFYPMQSALEAFSKDLSKFKTAKGSIQFPLDKPLPLSLISKIVKFRVQKSREGTIKWKS